MNEAQQALVESCIERYFRERDRYVKLAVWVADVVKDEIIEQNAIRAHVSFRAKGLNSFEGKVRRIINEKEDVNLESQVFDAVNDLAAVRVTTYQRSDVDLVVGRLPEYFAGFKTTDLTVELKEYPNDPENFYSAYHCDVTIKDSDISRDLENLRGTRCEIQICSMMSHVWNEIEHDIGYKPNGEPNHDERSLLVALGHLSRTGEELIAQLMNANQNRLEAAVSPFADAFDFAVRMRSRYPDIDMSKNVYRLYQYLLNQGLNTAAQIEQRYGKPMPEAQLRNLMTDFNQFLEKTNTVSYRMDFNSSDVMLMELFVKKDEARNIAAVISSNGRGRPTRMRSLTENYLRFINDEILITANPGEHHAIEDSCPLPVS